MRRWVNTVTCTMANEHHEDRQPPRAASPTPVVGVGVGAAAVWSSSWSSWSSWCRHDRALPWNPAQHRDVRQCLEVGPGIDAAIVPNPPGCCWTSTILPTASPSGKLLFSRPDVTTLSPTATCAFASRSRRKPIRTRDALSRYRSPTPVAHAHRRSTAGRRAAAPSSRPSRNRGRVRRDRRAHHRHVGGYPGLLALVQRHRPLEVAGRTVDDARGDVRHFLQGRASRATPATSRSVRSRSSASRSWFCRRWTSVVRRRLSRFSEPPSVTP